MGVVGWGVDYLKIKKNKPNPVKKNEIILFAATWMDLEIIILSEVSQRKTNII